jgi:hypothetical protein
MIEFAGKLPSPREILSAIAGAANRVPADAMAYGHRDASLCLTCTLGREERRWHDGSAFPSTHLTPSYQLRWKKGSRGRCLRANYDRLAQIKNQYDPDNLFHLNQNIKPLSRRAISLFRGGNL